MIVPCVWVCTRRVQQFNDLDTAFASSSVHGSTAVVVPCVGVNSQHVEGLECRVVAVRRLVGILHVTGAGEPSAQRMQR